MNKCGVPSAFANMNFGKSFFHGRGKRPFSRRKCSKDVVETTETTSGPNDTNVRMAQALNNLWGNLNAKSLSNEAVKRIFAGTKGREADMVKAQEHVLEQLQKSIS